MFDIAIGISICILFNVYFPEQYSKILSKVKSILGKKDA